MPALEAGTLTAPQLAQWHCKVCGEQAEAVEPELRACGLPGTLISSRDQWLLTFPLRLPRRALGTQPIDYV